MAKVTEDRTGLDNLISNLRQLQTKEVEAGVISSQQHPNFNGTVASLGALYEYGFERKYPKTGETRKVEAPFIQPVDTDSSNHKYVNKEFLRHLPLMISKKNTGTELLDQIGKEMAEEYKDYIKSGEVQFTVAGQYVPKQDGTRLIDTTTLVNSITYEVVRD